MTLEQSFPGLRNAPGGALIAVADNLFDFTGPANESMAQFLQDQSRQLTSQIKAIGPNWHYDEIGSDLTYRRPDVRVKDIAFDVTLARKTLGTAQVRDFFNTDFRPSRVVIIRPSQPGADHTYFLTRPETKR